MRLLGSVEQSGTEDGTRFKQRLQLKSIMSSGNYGKLFLVNFMSKTRMYIEDLIHDVVVREFDLVFD